MQKLTERIELKLTEDTFLGLQEIYQRHKISPQELCRAMAESAVEFYRINGSFSFPIILSRENPNDGKPDISVKTNPPNPTNDFRARQGNKTPSEKQESRFTGAIYKDAQNDDKPDQLTLLPLKPDRNALPGKTKRINKKEFRKGKAS